MNLFNTSRSLLFFGLVLSVPMLTGASGNGCGGQVVIGNDGGGSTTGTCSPTSCGEAVPALAQLCSDGTSVGLTCGVTSGGICGWVFNCPTTTCSLADCGPAPAIAEACPGGGSVSPVCNKSASGCGWSFPSCPGTTCTPSQCGVEPAIEVDCNGTVVSPVCEPTGQTGCGWVIPPCLPTALDAGAAPTCPTPQPQPCGAIFNCPCQDGTTQVGGCVNSFTCDEACCGHGGSK